MNVEESIKVFTENCGTIKVEYEDDRASWLQDYGLFSMGWLAGEKVRRQFLFIHAFVWFVIGFVVGLILR